MKKNPKCAAAKISRDEYAPEIAVNFDRQKLAENGMNLGTASTLAKNRIGGSIASFIEKMVKSIILKFVTPLNSDKM